MNARRIGIFAISAAVLHLFANAHGAVRTEPVGNTESGRAPVDISKHPWSSIGKLFNGTGEACTGFVVGSNKVLTAAHCLYNFRAKRFLPPEAIHFLIGYNKGEFRIDGRISAYRTGSGYNPDDEKTTASSDWAVLFLTEPLTGTKPLLLAPEMASVGKPIILAGFEQRRAYVLSADQACQLRGRLEGVLIASDCVARPGDSGGPLLVSAADGNYQVVGMQVASAKTVATGVEHPLSIAISARTLEKALADSLDR